MRGSMHVAQKRAATIAHVPPDRVQAGAFHQGNVRPPASTANQPTGLGKRRWQILERPPSVLLAARARTRALGVDRAAEIRLMACLRARRGRRATPLGARHTKPGAAPYRGEHMRWGLGRRPRVEGRLRIVLHGQRDAAREVVARKLGGNRERAAANRRDVARRQPEPPHLRDVGAVGERRRQPEAPGHAEEVTAFDVGKPLDTSEPEAAVGRELTALERGDAHRRIGKPLEDLERPRDVELRQPGEESEHDAKGFGHETSLGTRSWARPGAWPGAASAGRARFRLSLAPAAHSRARSAAAPSTKRA